MKANRTFVTLVALSVLVTLSVSTTPTSAETIFGLTTSQQIVQFDSSSPGTIINTSPVINGLSGGDRISDIDVYPVNGVLHGIGNLTGNLYRINALTGAAFLDVSPQASLGGPTDIDFNPAADRLRVFSANDSNFRLTPSVNTGGSTGASAGAVSSDGVFSYGGGSPNPNLVGNAYTNNFDGTLSTSLYSIDTDTDSLVLHSGAPQFSTLNTVGSLGVNVGSMVGFDISFTGATFVSDGNNLYSVNLGSGLLSPLGLIGSPLFVETIATPEPSTFGLIFAACGCLTARSRRAYVRS